MNNGYHIHEANPFYVQALAERRALHTAVERLRKLVADRSVSNVTNTQAAELRRCIGKLCDHLARHVAEETAGGCLEEASARNPKIAAEAEVLQRKYRDFLKTAENLRSIAERPSRTADAWNALRSDCDQFAERLREFEPGESALLQNAFNEAPEFES